MASAVTVHEPLRDPIGYAGTDNYINCEKGLWSWLTTVDHKRIGLMYMIGIAISFMLGGAFALIIRWELFNPGENTFPWRALQWLLTRDGEQLNPRKMYNQVMTLHGAVMVFMVIIPSIPAILGNFVLPLQLGAKDVAFPRLNLFSFYLWAAGGGLAIYSMLTHSVDTGWTFYTPYSSSAEVGSTTAVIPMTMGAFVMGFSSILTGLNFIVTVHKLRAPGMTWFRMPLFIWALYATSVVQILATPVLGITLALLCMERFLGIGIFDPAMGGDPILYQHFFWFYSHPAVYIMILPAMGVVSELMSCFSHKKIFGYLPIAFSSVGIALVGFLVWGHHLFLSGQSEVATMIFSFLSLSVAPPSAIKVFNWLATMYKGRLWLVTPMLYALGFIWLFTIGGLTGVFIAIPTVDVPLHDTYFIVAHFHYVMVGSAIFAMMGGFHYWWPKIFGRMYPEALGKVGFWLVFAGFNITFFPQFILGLRGMPRRYADYAVPPGNEAMDAAFKANTELFHILHQLSTVGAFIIGIGFLVIGSYLAWTIWFGPKASGNPWGATTLEWTTTSPPGKHNFDKIPVVTGGPYDGYSTGGH